MHKLTIILLLFIQLSICSKDFIVSQSEQSFLKFSPDECYYYHGMSVKVKSNDDKPTFTFYESSDCSGSSIEESSKTSPLITLMNNVKQFSNYQDSPNYIGTIAFHDEKHCPNTKNIVREYFNGNCKVEHYGSRKYEITSDNLFVSKIFRDHICNSVSDTRALCRCDTCTNNVSCTCGSDSLLIISFIGLILFFFF